MTTGHRRHNQIYNRKDMEARYEMFDAFALNDQRNYYNAAMRKFHRSAAQVNRVRALAAFLTGLFAALSGYIVQTHFVTGAACAAGTTPMPDYCSSWSIFLGVFLALSVAMPAVGAFFNTLADLYQWDRQITIYDAARENVELADARSPLSEMDDLTYRASLRAFAEGTLLVMEDETTQWGQAIRTPPQLERYIAEEMVKASAASTQKTRLDKTEAETQAAKDVVDPNILSARFDEYMADIEAREQAERIQRRRALDALNPPASNPEDTPPASTPPSTPPDDKDPSEG
ncbi:MAG: hypothetical protein K8L99_12845 [Anaerolineae bacterium]|nr:hypothetical protein [Anaerolineae bacterium]